MTKLNLDNLVLPDGVSFRLKRARTIFEYINIDRKENWFYEIRRSHKGVIPEDGKWNWTIWTDLIESMRMYAGYDADGVTISVIETDEVLFQEPKKQK